MADHIDPNELDEKQRMELAAALIFLPLYNRDKNTQFRVQELNDTPDVLCIDPITKATLELEITHVSDRQDDIGYMLGRIQVADEFGLDRVVDFQSDVIPQLVHRLEDKLLASYGDNTALVIRQSSPLWSVNEWQRHVPHIIRNVMRSRETNYGKGIWLVSNNPSLAPSHYELFCIFDPDNGLTQSTLSEPQRERVVGLATWESMIPEEFIKFSEREDVDAPIRIASPHECEYAVLIAFHVDEPEEERNKAISFYRDQMVYFCPCGKGSAKLLGNWITLRD